MTTIFIFMSVLKTFRRIGHNEHSLCLFIETGFYSTFKLLTIQSCKWTFGPNQMFCMHIHSIMIPVEPFWELKGVKEGNIYKEKGGS